MSEQNWANLAQLIDAKTKVAFTKSECCNAAYLWLTCDECEFSSERHDFATCSKCGQDIED